MKNHIVFKFLAILLCAACLMGAVASGLGMFVLAESDLYNRPVEEVYADYLASHSQSLAGEILQRYVSMNLGGANAHLVDDMYGNYWSNRYFDMDHVGYVIRDEAGNEVHSQMMGQQTPVKYTHIFDAGEFGSYLRVVSQMPETEYYERHDPQLQVGITTHNGDDYVYNAIPEAGADVYFVTVQHEDSSWGIGSAEKPLGKVICRTDGVVEFFGEEGVNLLKDASLMTGIIFLTQNETALYEAFSPNGILQEGTWTGSTTRLTLRQLEEPVMVMDAIPPEGCTVIRMSVTYEDGYSESLGGAPEIGHLGYEKGSVRFVPSNPGAFTYRDAAVIHIAFYDQDDALVFEARNPEGVGYFAYQDEVLSFLASSSMPEAEEEPAEMGVRAIVQKKTPIWKSEGERLQKTGTYYGKDYEITIYAVKVVDGILYGCTNGLYLTDPEHPLCDWVAMEDVEILSYVRSVTDKGRPALCQSETEVWALDGEEFYETGMHYQQGQKIGILVLGTFDSGEWGLTDMGWVQLENISWLEDVGAATSLEETVADAEAVPEESIPSDTVPETVSEVPATEETVTVPEETVFPTVEETVPVLTEVSETITEETASNDTEIPTESVLADYAVAEASAGDTNIYGYWDNEAQQNMIVEYVYEQMPDYTVELQLAEGAVITDYSWMLARALYAYRNQLPWLLGICLLMFAVLTVYLCCAAGRKPGTNVVRFEGLNRLPLDLYAVMTVGGVCLAAVLAVNGTEYLLQSSIRIGILFAGLVVYAACLLVVGFGFACAAQFKTPGLWWWRHSVCFLSLKFVGFVCRKLWQFSRKLTKKCETGLWPWLVRLCKGVVKVVAALLKIGGIWLRKLLAWLQKGGNWLWSRMSRFFSLLPLTWQWLLAGLAMFFLMGMVFAANGEELLMVLCIGICVGLILYGAHCFGTLLEGVKHMRKGDLDAKVDDRLMVGAFREFAGELNGLADVAVVAAQKQLKSERMKTELITNVSHDIKTPLTSIINYVDLLQKPHTDEDQEKYLEVLDRQSQRLKKLIDDLMEMSKASTGNMTVDVTWINAAEAVNQALGEFGDKLEKAQLYPVFRQPEEPVYMMADGRLVWRVMSNLLSNAVKYALPGTRVYVDLQKLENKVIISMKNISREELNVEADELLERFVRGDASRNTEGSGLGLNIAQSLMELQKGQLQILVDGDLFKVTLIFPGVE